MPHFATLSLTSMLGERISHSPDAKVILAFTKTAELEGMPTADV